MPWSFGHDPLLIYFHPFSFQVAVGSKVTGCKNRYDCCDRKARSKGCTDLCKKCDKPWGTKANECYEKEHNIIVVVENEGGIAGAAAAAAAALTENKRRKISSRKLL